MEFRLPIELPTWGNVTLLCIVTFMVGFVVRDLIQVFRDK